MSGVAPRKTLADKLQDFVEEAERYGVLTQHQDLPFEEWPAGLVQTWNEFVRSTGIQDREQHEALWRCINAQDRAIRDSSTIRGLVRLLLDQGPLAPTDIP